MSSFDRLASVLIPLLGQMYSFDFQGTSLSTSLLTRLSRHLAQCNNGSCNFITRLEWQPAKAPASVKRLGLWQRKGEIACECGMGRWRGCRVAAPTASECAPAMRRGRAAGVRKPALLPCQLLPAPAPRPPLQLVRPPVCVSAGTPLLRTMGLLSPPTGTLSLPCPTLASKWPQLQLLARGVSKVTIMSSLCCFWNVNNHPEVGSKSPFLSYKLQFFFFFYKWRTHEDTCPGIHFPIVRSMMKADSSQTTSSDVG